ncbi:hypothetical protein IFO70_04595 [Phormidium tenue FACHB-886]|nr:hypothetical protein [Phormidium tenue FACHB-886]
MQQLDRSHSYPVAAFPEQPSAEHAKDVLLQSGFADRQLSIVSQSLPPAVKETKLAESARGGALVGTVFGTLVGFVLGYFSLASGVFGDLNPLQHLLGVSLAGSAVGTAGGALIAAVAGAQVVKGDAGADYISRTQRYVIFLEGNAEEVLQAKNVLQEKGIEAQLEEI